MRRAAGVKGGENHGEHLFYPVSQGIVFPGCYCGGRRILADNCRTVQRRETFLQTSSDTRLSHLLR